MAALSFRKKFTNYLFASYPFLWVQSHEESKVCSDILGVCEENKDLAFYEWDCITGLVRLEKGKDKVNRRVIQDTALPNKAIEYIKKITDSRQIFAMKDFHPFFQNPAITRSVRNLADELKNRGNMLVFISPLLNVPIELEKEIQIVDYRLPDEKALEERLIYVIDSAKQEAKSAEAKAKLDITDEIKRDAVEAAKGMTDSEAENAFTLAVVENKQFNHAFIETVFNEKITQVKKNSLLTYLNSDFTFKQVGGLKGLKQWISLRAKGYEEKARAYGLPYPKGILLAGIPGTGKSLIAKATAAELGFPLFQLDIGALFGKLVGESEENFRKVIKQVDGIGRCVLFID